MENGKILSLYRLPYSSSDCIVLNNCHIYLAQFFLLDCSLSVVGLPCDKQNFLYLLEYQINKQQITLVLTYPHVPSSRDFGLNMYFSAVRS